MQIYYVESHYAVAFLRCCLGIIHKMKEYKVENVIFPRIYFSWNILALGEQQAVECETRSLYFVAISRH